MDARVTEPKFQHFERVFIRRGKSGRDQPTSTLGTVIWLDSYSARAKCNRPDQWQYIVYLPDDGMWKTFYQSELESAGEFDSPSVHLGKCPELSFDLAKVDDYEFMEGSYRLPGESWKVFLFHKADVLAPAHKFFCWKRPTQWEQDVSGVIVDFPNKAKMGQPEIAETMSQLFGQNEWFLVNGPDSMSLR